MVVIGVLAPKHTASIIKTVKFMLAQKGKTGITIAKGRAKSEYIAQLRDTKLDFVITDVLSDGECGIFFDMVIADATAGIDEAEWLALSRHITASTLIIYNADVENSVINKNDNSVSYGLSANSQVSVSSVSHYDGGAELVYCVSGGMLTLGGIRLEMSESAVKFDGEGFNIHHILAGVACAVLID